MIDRFLETRQVQKVTNFGMKYSSGKYMLETRHIWELMNLQILNLEEKIDTF